MRQHTRLPKEPTVAQYILYEQTEDIVKLTINRPEKRNVISRRVYTELLHDHLKLHPSKNLFKGWNQPSEKLGLWKV